MNPKLQTHGMYFLGYFSKPFPSSGWWPSIWVRDHPPPFIDNIKSKRINVSTFHFSSIPEVIHHNILHPYTKRRETSSLVSKFQQSIITNSQYKENKNNDKNNFQNGLKIKLLAAGHAVYNAYTSYPWGRKRCEIISALCKNSSSEMVQQNES